MQKIMFEQNIVNQNAQPHYLGNSLEQFKNCGRLSLGFHCMIIAEALVSLVLV
jgi:hypothetical protein